MDDVFKFLLGEGPLVGVHFGEPVSAQVPPYWWRSHLRDALRVRLAPARRNRIYLSGPMTGLPELNFPAFNAAAESIRAEGFHVENPADHGEVAGAEWGDYLRYDIGRLATCEIIALLPGWENSKGARFERMIAGELGMEVVPLPGAVPEDLVAETTEACDMGVGCEEVGICYAEAQGRPDQCLRNAAVAGTRVAELEAHDEISQLRARVAELTEECNRLNSACHETFNNFTVAHKSVCELRGRVAELEAQLERAHIGLVPEGMCLVPHAQLAAAPQPTPALEDQGKSCTCYRHDETHGEHHAALCPSFAAAPAPSAPAEVEGERAHRLLDFSAIHDKRMSELTPEQRDDALELWLREQIGGPYETARYDQHSIYVSFLLKRLDEARAQLGAVPMPDAMVEALRLAANRLDRIALELPEPHRSETFEWALEARQSISGAALTTTGGREEVLKALTEAVVYLNSDTPNTIYTESILHRRMRDALTAAQRNAGEK